jgi:hypothetical protein
MATCLPPVERPRGPILKLIHVLGRRRLGTVPTPLTVFSARMPLASRPGAAS